jgi:hypothetical protein
MGTSETPSSTSDSFTAIGHAAGRSSLLREPASGMRSAEQPYFRLVS